MKTKILVVILSSVILSFTSCGNSDDEPEVEIKDNCNLRVEERPPVDMDFTLKAIQTGDATVTRLVYKTIERNDTIYNPTLPWEKKLNVPAVTNFHFEAIGTAKNGILTISYYGSLAGMELSGKDDCYHSID